MDNKKLFRIDDGIASDPEKFVTEIHKVSVDKKSEKKGYSYHAVDFCSNFFGTGVKNRRSFIENMWQSRWNRIKSGWLCTVTGLWNGYVWVIHGFRRRVICTGLGGAGD